MLLLWSRRTVLYLEIDSFDDVIKQINEKEELTEDEKAEYRAEVDKIIEQAKEELDMVIKKFDEVQAMVAKNKEEYLAEKAREDATEYKAQDEYFEGEEPEHIELWAVHSAVCRCKW